MGQRSVRFPDELEAWAVARAGSLERPFSWVVVKALEAYRANLDGGALPSVNVFPDPVETVVRREGDPELAGQRHPGLGRCPKATCQQTGIVGGTCPDHRNLRFKA